MVSSRYINSGQKSKWQDLIPALGVSRCSCRHQLKKWDNFPVIKATTDLRVYPSRQFNSPPGSTGLPMVRSRYTISGQKSKWQIFGGQCRE